MVYSEDKKAAALAALLQGQSVSSVARQYNIPRTTVIGWRNAAGLSDSGPTVSDEKKAELGGLIADYLTAALITLREQVEVFRDTDWLKKQPASEVAVLHGVLADKTIRLLEAAEAARNADSNEASE